jgi:hypothetical protein
MLRSFTRFVLSAVGFLLILSVIMLCFRFNGITATAIPTCIRATLYNSDQVMLIDARNGYSTLLARRSSPQDFSVRPSGWIYPSWQHLVYDSSTRRGIGITNSVIVETPADNRTVIFRDAAVVRDTVSWSPDGKHLAMAVSEPNANDTALLLANADGTDSRIFSFADMSGGEHSILWFPDSSYVVLHRFNAFIAVNVANLTSYITPTDRRLYALSIKRSRTGHGLAYLAEENGATKLFVLNLDSGQEFSVLIPKPVVGINDLAFLSLKSQRAVIFQEMDHDNVRVPFSLSLANLNDSTGPAVPNFAGTSVHHRQAIAWTLDGQSVIYVDSKSADLTIYHADTGVFETLASGEVTFAQTTDDWHYLVFGRRANKQFELSVVDLNSKRITVLASVANRSDQYGIDGFWAYVVDNRNVLVNWPGPYRLSLFNLESGMEQILADKLLVHAETARLWNDNPVFFWRTSNGDGAVAYEVSTGIVRQYAADFSQLANGPGGQDIFASPDKHSIIISGPSVTRGQNAAVIMPLDTDRRRSIMFYSKVSFQLWQAAWLPDSSAFIYLMENGLTRINIDGAFVWSVKSPLPNNPIEAIETGSCRA